MNIDTVLLLAIALKDTAPGKRLSAIVAPSDTPPEQARNDFDRLAQAMADATIQSPGTPAEAPRVNTAAKVASANAVNVLSSAPVRLDDPILPNRRFCMIQNLGPNAIWLGPSNSVSTGFGIQVPASGGTISLDIGPDQQLWAIASTADQVTGTANTRVIQAS